MANKYENIIYRIFMTRYEENRDEIYELSYSLIRFSSQRVI